VREVGARLSAGLAELPAVQEVRGAGLLIGCDLDRPAADVMASCLERGLVVGTAGEQVLRLTPPLVVSADEVDEALDILSEVLQ
jgi:acetylornithine/N-succinyldiaminopimelate aminotransferase